METIYDYEVLKEDFILTMSKEYSLDDINYVWETSKPIETYKRYNKEKYLLPLYAEKKRIRTNLRSRINGPDERRRLRAQQKALTKKWRKLNVEHIKEMKQADKLKNQQSAKDSINSGSYYNKWSLDETILLLDGICEGLNWLEISKKTSRSVSGCIKRAVNVTGTRTQVDIIKMSQEGKDYRELKWI